MVGMEVGTTDCPTGKADDSIKRASELGDVDFFDADGIRDAFPAKGFHFPVIDHVENLLSSKRPKNECMLEPL